MIEILVDADACPVKDEVYRVARRYGLPVHVVSNSGLAVPPDPLIARVLVEQGPDVADDWIAGRARAGSIVVTADVPLAARCVAAGATVLDPRGRAFTPGSIGMQLATRNLMTELRSAGATTGGPSALTRRDRSAFLQALDLAVHQAGRPAASRSLRMPDA
ncbi:YaiI/YqxD family protein [Roseomonas sp. NAR14]|uniref:UPF0178 protein M0638_14920 n=1 Tax=Roseomonas acroporae TaxID=2937791 RepID=A0A9X1Y923_9PROT|nr:YaiI/YqxD family protein [Roseomonas acroporae]MCK8785676.1 YaiI/YqxD family protein [Roseomonas acroporae]